jgi:hypothetical protein
MQPYLISHLERVWNPMLIMALILFGIGFMKNVMKFLLNVPHSVKKFGYLINLGLSMEGIFHVQLHWEETCQWG